MVIPSTPRRRARRLEDELQTRSVRTTEILTSVSVLEVVSSSSPGPINDEPKDAPKRGRSHPPRGFPHILREHDIPTSIKPVTSYGSLKRKCSVFPQTKIRDQSPVPAGTAHLGEVSAEALVLFRDGTRGRGRLSRLTFELFDRRGGLQSPYPLRRGGPRDSRLGAPGLRGRGSHWAPVTDCHAALGVTYAPYRFPRKAWA